MRQSIKAGLLAVAGIAAGVFLVGRTLNREEAQMQVFRKQHSYILYRLPYHLKEPFVKNVASRELEAWMTTLCQPQAWTDMSSGGLRAYAQRLVDMSERELTPDETEQAIEVLEYAIPIIQFTCPS